MLTNKTVETVRENYNLLKINSVLFGYILEKIIENKNINTHGLCYFEI